MNKKNLLIFGFVVVVVGLVCYIMFGGNNSSSDKDKDSSSPTSVLKDYCEGVKSLNASKVISTYNKSMVKVLDDNINDAYDEYDTYKEYLADKLKVSEFEVKSYEIDEDYDLYDRDDLEDLADAIEDYYDIKAAKIKEAREYKVKYRVKSKYGIETNKTKVVLVKIDNNWYVVPNSV